MYVTNFSLLLDSKTQKKKYFNIEPIQLIQGNKIYSKTIFAVILISQRDKQLIISSIFTYDGRLLLNHLMRCCLSISMLGSTAIFIRGQRTINAVCSCQHFCILFRIEMNSIDPAWRWKRKPSGVKQNSFNPCTRQQTVFIRSLSARSD